MKAVLLCAGFATRLYPLTRDFPKPLLPVADKPIVQDLVEQLIATQAVQELYIVSNHRFAHHFEAWREEFLETAPAIRIEVLDDGTETNDTRLGAVRDLALTVEHFALSGPLLIAAGDNIFRFPMQALFNDYAAHPRNLVLTYHEPDTARLQRCGVAQIGAEGRLIALVEKPEVPPTQYCCPPLYILEQSAIAALPAFLTTAADTDAPGNLIAWLAERQEVYTHLMDGQRLDIGDVESYRRAGEWLRDREQGLGVRG